MAEGVGFEPTDPCGSPVFKTGALNRSAIPPIGFRCLIRELSLFSGVLAFANFSPKPLKNWRTVPKDYEHMLLIVNRE